MNAHLPERFRGNARPGFPHSASLPPSHTPLAKVNLGIRAYARAADDIMKSSSNRWLRQPEFPASAEILIAGEGDVSIPANKINGAWKSKERYLKAHYNLLREDAVSPLRDAVEHFRQTPDMMENDNNRVVWIYEKVNFVLRLRYNEAKTGQVHIAGFTFAPLGIAARIRFSTNRAGKAIPWRHSKRLMAGTIVALSPAKDKFDTVCIIAVVAARPIAGVEDTPPQIDIYFSRTEDIEIDPQLEWTMIEAKQGYFEAARHTLRALQKLSQETYDL
jgi:helicase required for RNAi-mediated heterochromatin assembly 1